MVRTFTTWVEIEADSQEEAVRKFEAISHDDLCMEELEQMNIDEEKFLLYENLDLIKEI